MVVCGCAVWLNMLKKASKKASRNRAGGGAVEVEERHRGGVGTITNGE